MCVCVSVLVCVCSFTTVHQEMRMSREEVEDHHIIRGSKRWEFLETHMLAENKLYICKWRTRAIKTTVRWVENGSGWFDVWAYIVDVIVQRNQRGRGALKS